MGTSQTALNNSIIDDVAVNHGDCPTSHWENKLLHVTRLLKAKGTIQELYCYQTLLSIVGS